MESPHVTEPDFRVRQSRVTLAGTLKPITLVKGEPDRIYVGFFGSTATPGTTARIGVTVNLTAASGIVVSTDPHHFRYKWEGSLCAQQWYVFDSTNFEIEIVEVIYRPTRE